MEIGNRQEDANEEALHRPIPGRDCGTLGSPEEIVCGYRDFELTSYRRSTISWGMLRRAKQLVPIPEPESSTPSRLGAVFCDGLRRTV